MHIIICGAGQVGESLLQSLSLDDFDITLVDRSYELLERFSKRFDVNVVAGSPSYPNVQKEAGAEKADMIIAVTDSDEINMIICQVAHSFFRVPHKIARIHSQNYLDVVGSEFFSKNHMPIDLIISPEYEVAKDIAARFFMPGVFDMVRLSHDEATIVSVKCLPKSEIVKTPIKNIPQLFGAYSFQVMAIKRGTEEAFIAKNDDLILEGDEVYFFAPTNEISSIVSLFGHKPLAMRRAVIIGGSDVGYYLAFELEKSFEKKLKLFLIEEDKRCAEYIANYFPKINVLQGNVLEEESILEECDIEEVDLVASITEDDDYNILTSLLVKQYGKHKDSIVLMNRVNFMPFAEKIGIDSIVSPKVHTVSKILEYMRGRKGGQSIHRMRDGWAEIIELPLEAGSYFIGKKLASITFDPHILFAGVIRSQEIFMPMPSFQFEENDVLIFLARLDAVEKLQKLIDGS